MKTDDTGSHQPVCIHELRFALGNWRILIFPLALAAVAFRIFHFHPVVTFFAAALALLPLASVLGDATEELAGHVGTTAGALLNATVGNGAELVFGLVALSAGHSEVVKASLVGSVIGNLLLVFGLAVFVGGLGREKLTFNRVAVGAGTSMLFLAVVALVMPAVFQLTMFGSPRTSAVTIERLSVWTAGVLLASYVASLVFSLRTHRLVLPPEGPQMPRIRRSGAILLLVAAAGLIAIVSGILVGQIEPATRALGWTELFVGLIVVAIVGNAAEHSSAVLMARKGKMDLALGIAVGSSTQIALLVAPALVLASQLRPPTLTLLFHPMEIVAVIASVGLVTVIALDGESNWFEGLQLLAVYTILAIFFYLLPAR